MLISFFLFFFIQGWAVLFFFVFLAAYLAYNLYNPKPKPGVSVVMVATPSRKVYTAKSGLQEAKKYRLAKARLSMLDLKRYVHSKSNRNVLITGSSGQVKSKLTRYLLSEMPYQKLIFSFKAGEEYLKMGYATKAGNGFALTEKGLRFLDSDNIIEGASNLGSGLRIRIIKKTIEKLH